MGKPGEPVGADVDVAIVGAGPVGLVLAILLGQRGRRVRVVERQLEPYPLPRAVSFDGESGRILQAAGVGEALAAISEPVLDYDWRDGAGRTLLHFGWEGLGPCGWPEASTFSQPALEAALVERLGALPSVDVVRGLQVADVAQDDDGATVAVVGAPPLRARYVVGCDGAGSRVREAIGTTVTDLGFDREWLVVDVVPPPAREWRPGNLQLCDPARPTTLVSGGPGRRRFEFLRLPGESAEALNRPQEVWRLLGRWGLTRTNTTLERHAPYTFRARVADRWRDRRVLIAGDAAHLLPPFAGQGLCAGLRDAANLAWKLDLVLGGDADPALLDTYGAERRGHVEHAMRVSVELGLVICTLDPEQAAARDAFLLAAGGDPQDLFPLPPPALAGGPVARGDGEGAAPPPGGLVTPQGRVRRGDRTGRFDDVVGTGWVVAGRTDPADALPAPLRAFVERLGAHLVTVVPADGSATAPPDAVVDLDGAHLGHLAATGHDAVVVRPDFIAFGGATADGLPALVADLERQLGR